MEQNARPAPDNDLDAYGDWVTIDTAAPPVPAGRQAPAASADVEIAGELTDAEEEFLGKLSEADHTAATGVAAPGAGPAAHNRNGHGNGHGNGHADPGAGREGRGDGERATPDTGTTPALGPAARAADEAVAVPAASAVATAAAVANPPTGTVVPAAAPSAPVPHPAQAPLPLPAVPVPPAAAVAPHTRAAAIADAVAAARPPHGAPAAADLPAPSVEPAPQPAGEPGERDTLASIQQRVATLAAEITEISAQIARLQGAGDSGVAAETAAHDSNRVQVSIEELAGESPATDGDSRSEPETARATAIRGSHPAPVIRLMPIADEEDDVAGNATTAGEAEQEDTAPHAARDTPLRSSQGHELFRTNVRDVLGYLDQLLDDLPPERVREFAQSPQFATYKALFTELGLDD